MMNKGFRDYIAGAGSFLLDTTREAVWQHEKEAIKEEQAVGMSITVAALYDAGVKDEQIVHLIQKYYNVTERDAQEQLRIEKTIEHPCRELVAYLIREEAFSLAEAHDYIIEHGTVDMLREIRGLWKMSPKELLKKIVKA